MEGVDLVVIVFAVEVGETFFDAVTFRESNARVPFPTVVPVLDEDVPMAEETIEDSTSDTPGNCPVDSRLPPKSPARIYNGIPLELFMGIARKRIIDYLSHISKRRHKIVTLRNK